MRVLVLDIFSRNGLAIVDALRSSHELVGGARGQGPSRRFFRSAALKDVFRYPSPLKDSAGFGDAVLAACARYRAEAVFPASTASSLALSRLRADRSEPEGTTFLVEELEKLLQLADKWQLYQLCTELGISTPPTVLLGVSPPDDVAAMKLPVIAKPRAGEASRGVRILETRAELERFADDPPLVGTDLGDSHPYILQEIVRGENHGAGGCSFRGDVLTTTTGRSILTRHDFGGFGIVHETTSESAIAAQLAAIMHRLTWNGPLELESVRDEKGNFHAIDANPRIWGGIELAMRAQDLGSLRSAETRRQRFGRQGRRRGNESFGTKTRDHRPQAGRGDVEGRRGLNQGGPIE